MSHIHTNPGEHDATVSGYIVRLDTPEPTLMLHKHKTLGAWLQFGGHVELNENPWQALAHELREEAGYEISQLNILQPPHRIRSLTGVALHPIPILQFTHKFPKLDHYHSDQGYGFVTDQAPAHQPDEQESEVIQCFTLDQLQKMSDKEIPVNVVEVGEFLLSDGFKYWDQAPASEWSLETPPAHFE